MPTAIATEKRQKSLKAKKRELYREAVLDAAERVFGDEGYEATKVQRIAAESGLSLTTLYSVFESKWEIQIWRCSSEEEHLSVTQEVGMSQFLISAKIGA